jgi:hypothetical protein
VQSGTPPGAALWYRGWMPLQHPTSPDSTPPIDLSTAVTGQPVADGELLMALEEIVAALDRRIPHVERAGEALIAADAQRLRTCAMNRIARLVDDRTPADIRS